MCGQACWGRRKDGLCGSGEGIGRGGAGIKGFEKKSRLKRRVRTMFKLFLEIER